MKFAKYNACENCLRILIMYISGLCGGTLLNAWSVCRLTCFYDEVMRYIRDEDYANR